MIIVRHIEGVWSAGVGVAEGRKGMKLRETKAEDGVDISVVGVGEAVDIVSRTRLGWDVTLLRTDHYNTTTAITNLPQLILKARQVGLGRSCVVVVVASDSLPFLSALGHTSLTHRLMTWGWKMVVVTSVALHHITPHLLTPPSSSSSSSSSTSTLSSTPSPSSSTSSPSSSTPSPSSSTSSASSSTSPPSSSSSTPPPSSWTFTMMDTIFLIYQKDTEAAIRWEVFNYLPFGPGGGQVLRVWSNGRSPPQPLIFPNKFHNFNGARIGVTALPYKPYWEVVKEGGNGLSSEMAHYSGSDRKLLEAVASTLNFTIHVLPVTTWAQVVGQVEARQSLVASVVHMMLPQRTKRFSFTTTYEHGINLGFAMAKPSLRPRWESLYYPLTEQVWVAVLAVLVVVPVLLYLVR
ncbi:hypothetical protein Pmani_028571 [Petrolisthes manimaculis]|uniref:Uncharacterized protein n=1 Tax=Petrolisthes manimaculis TaxID=1843537 RepID=A0AAE1P187_9EUCA|nr:hypothetical protein Pmani_028571 [Petrolisthes manimaculis]